MRAPICPFEVVVLVASLGGLAAVSQVLTTLPAGFPMQVLVVQHGRRDGDPHRLTRLLQKVTAIPVRTAHHGTPLYHPGVTVIPPGYLATVEPTHHLTLADADSPRGGDSLLTSLAVVAGPAAIAVVLTGMLHDGAQGVRAIKRNGGRVIVQDPSTARAASMPSSAIATGCVDFVLPLARITPALIALTMAPGGADLLAVPTPSWARLHA